MLPKQTPENTCRNEASMGVSGEPPQTHAIVKKTYAETVDGNNPAPPNQDLIQKTKGVKHSYVVKCYPSRSLALPLINVVQQWGGAGLFPFVEKRFPDSMANINLGVTEGGCSNISVKHYLW